MRRMVVWWLLASLGCNDGTLSVPDAATIDGSACASRSIEGTTGSCGDGCDNDGDGRVDCADPGCAGRGGCPVDAGDVIAEDAGVEDAGVEDASAEEAGDSGASCWAGAEADATACSDGCDNDFDGQVDCEDSGCAGIGGCPPTCAPGAETTATLCSDGCDNDFDGAIDCGDSGCAGVGACPPGCTSGAESSAPLCSDGCDNDGDMLTDCADPGCAGLGACPPACPSGSESTAALCADACDNDGDGQVDCSDSGCAGVGSCPPLPVCTPGETRCSGPTEIQTCTSTAQWPASSMSCPLGCNTVGGAHCAECNTGALGFTCDAAGNRVRCGADGRVMTESCPRGCSDGVCIGPRTINVVNDLRNTALGGIDWDRLNGIISVRIASTEAAVRAGTGERMTGPYDLISPGGSSCSGFSCTDSFDTESMGTSYYVLIMNDWYDYSYGVPGIKRGSAVTCCSCSAVCEKWAIVHVTGHTGGELVIRASDFLPQTTWCGSSFCS